MFYLMYLSSLCQRRHWPDPYFETYQTRYGWGCTVRVNNREYQTETEYETQELAQNAAAARAYMICRNFSVNDGMYPGQRQGQGGVIQGLPVAIGTGRRTSTYSAANAYPETSSGSSSPRSSDSELDVAGRRESRGEIKPMCYCGRDSIRQYDRCGSCLRERGWR